MLAAGHHVVFQPGVYTLNETLIVGNKDQVLLGLGLATLQTSNGQPAIIVSNVEGVRIAGLLLQAGPGNASPSLLQWGHSTGLNVDGDATNPGFLQDVFARVGGTNDQSTAQVSTIAMVVIYSGNVVIDNAWYWRADRNSAGAPV